MPALCLLSLISRNSPKQLGMVSLELLFDSPTWGSMFGVRLTLGGDVFFLFVLL